MTTELTRTRRAFFWTAGAAMSTPLVAAPVAADEGGDEAAARLAALEDVNAIRTLVRSYAKHVAAGEHAAAAALCTEPSGAGLDPAVTALSAAGFGAGDAVELAADGCTATARMRCAVEIATPIEPVCTLVAMARAQGEGVLRRSDLRVLESTCVKQDGTWRIHRAAWRT